MVIHSIEHYENRINLLKSKGEVQNEKLIKKLMRKKRKLDEAGA